MARRTASAGMEIVLNFGICSYIDSMSVASPLFPVWGRSSAFAAGGGVRLLCARCGDGGYLLIRFLLLLLISVATAAGPLVRAARAAVVDFVVASLVESEGMGGGLWVSHPVCRFICVSG